MKIARLGDAGGSVGAKGDSLSALAGWGSVIPPTWVIRNAQDIDTRSQSFLDEIEGLLVQNSAVERWVVRSSSTDEDRPFALAPGVYDTYLGLTSSAGIANAVRHCVESLHSENAVSYRAAVLSRGENEIPKMHVLLQPVIECEISGVAYSMDPTSAVPCVLVEAIGGVGADLVGGGGKPQIERLPRPADSAGSDGSAIARDRLFQHIAEVAVHLETRLGVPVDVEWGYTGSTLYMFQCRPAALSADNFPRQAAKPVLDSSLTTAQVLSPGFAVGVLVSEATRAITSPVAENVGVIRLLNSLPSAAELAGFTAHLNGIATFEGGALSHSAAMLRERSIPAVRTQLELSAPLDGLTVALDAVSGAVVDLMALPVVERKKLIFAAFTQMARRRSEWVSSRRFETVLLDPVQQRRLTQYLGRSGVTSTEVHQTILPFDDPDRTYSGISARIQVNHPVSGSGGESISLQFKRANALPDRPSRYDEEIRREYVEVEQATETLKELGYVAFEEQERMLTIWAIDDDCRIVENTWPGASGNYICQWPIGSARWRPLEVPIGGQQNCPSMADRSAHLVLGGIGHMLRSG